MEAHSSGSCGTRECSSDSMSGATSSLEMAAVAAQWSEAGSPYSLCMAVEDMTQGLAGDEWCREESSSEA